MSFLKKHYINIVQDDLLLTGIYPSVFRLPQLVKITLMLKGSTNSESDILYSSIALELIGQQKSYFRRHASNKTVTGSGITLRDTLMYHFLSRLVFEVLPKVKQFEGLKHPSHPGVYNFVINDLLLFGEVSQLLNQESLVAKGLHCEFHFNTRDSVEISKLGRLLTICFQETS